jgi:hypothetical protein
MSFLKVFKRSMATLAFLSRLTALRRLSLFFGIALVLAFWLRTNAAPMTQESPIDPTQQNSPFATATPDPFATATPDPFATATPDPFATATPDPFATATPDPFATATPDPFATATPDPFATATPDPFATATPDPFATATPDPFATATVDAGIAPDVTSPPDETTTLLLPLPPVDRPIAEPPATEPLNLALIITDVLSSMANVAVWLWFVCGSLIFFVVAGVIGGIYFSQRERERYDLYTLEPDEHAHFDVEQKTERRVRPPDDDVWPASLP